MKHCIQSPARSVPPTPQQQPLGATTVHLDPQIQMTPSSLKPTALGLVEGGRSDAQMQPLFLPAVHKWGPASVSSVASAVSDSSRPCGLAPLSMGFSRQGHWHGLPCPPPGELPDPGIKPTSPAPPALEADFFFYPLSHLGSLYRTPSLDLKFG